MARVVALTGAGISRESGLLTFRDADGLWAGYRIEEVCTPEALTREPSRVMEFYNLRRREIIQAEPNLAHHALAELQGRHEVHIITQNIDDLHERAGSRSVHHIHGEALKVRSIDDFDQQFTAREDVAWGECAPDGSLLRPHVCFFGESPYDFMAAVEAVMMADRVVIVGTSLQVYPAAGLVQYAAGRPITLIDPNPALNDPAIEVIPLPATVGVPAWAETL